MLKQGLQFSSFECPSLRLDLLAGVVQFVGKGQFSVLVGGVTYLIVGNPVCKIEIQTVPVRKDSMVNRF